MTPEELAKLTPEEKRIRIAELCGWTTDGEWIYGPFPSGRVKRNEVVVFGDAPNETVVVNDCWSGIRDDSESCAQTMPDYLNDLNAMHEAEKRLDERQQDVFAAMLGALTGGRRIDFGATRIEATTKILFATAAQRADAFLLCLSPDAPRPTGSGVAPPKSESAASAATPKENQ